MSSALLLFVFVGITQSVIIQVSSLLLLYREIFLSCHFFVQANVIFHFSLDFTEKQLSNSSEPIVLSTSTPDNEENLQDYNLTALAAWPERPQYNEAALEHLVATKRAVQQLNQELTPLVGRSNQLALLLKRTLRYANEVDSLLERSSPGLGDLVEQLRKYVALVQDLSTPSSQQGGSRTLEFVVLKLAMEKYEVLTTQQEVAAWLQQADEAWKRYQRTQVVIA